MAVVTEAAPGDDQARRGASDPGHADQLTATPTRPVIRVIENDAACDYTPLAAIASIATDITPEDIIGPERDWTHHLHLRIAYLPRVVCTQVHADSYYEAADEAIGDAMAHRNDDLSAAGLSFPRDFYSPAGQLPYCLHELGDACREGCAAIVVTLME